MLLNTLHAHDFTGEVAVTADSDKDVGMLRDRGADLVFMPFPAAADQAADLLLGKNRRAVTPEPFAIVGPSERRGAAS